MQAHAQNPSPPDTTEGVEEDEYGYDVEDTGAYDEEYVRQQYQQNQGQQYAGSPIGRTSPWTAGNEWRSAGSSGLSTSSGGHGGNHNVAIDDVQRALSALEIASNSNTGQGGQNQMYQNQSNVGNYQAGQSAHPPRFNPTHPPPAQAPGMRGAGGNGGNGNGNGGRKLQLNTDLEGRKTPQAQQGAQYLQQQQYQQQQHQQQDNRSQSSGGSWDQKDRTLGGRTSNPNLQYGYQQGGKGSGSGVPSVPAIPQQYIQQQQPRMGGGTYNQGGGNQQQQQGGGGSSGQSPNQGFVNTPVDVPSLIATKGYNPANFDTRPQFVRQLLP